MRQVTPVDGFRLAYDRAGRGPAVLLLHGWPGYRADYREVAPLVADAAEAITPDLRGSVAAAWTCLVSEARSACVAPARAGRCGGRELAARSTRTRKLEAS